MKHYLFLTGLYLSCILYLSACGQVSSQEIKSPPQQPSQQPAVSGMAGTGWLPSDSVGAISWMAHPGNTYFIQGNTSNEFYLYIQVRGNDVLKDNAKRVPLNISMVLDRSGSMSGDKIAYAKKAASFVVEQLSNDDILSIVNYDDKVEITSASEQVRNKEVLKKKIIELFDRGSTNLTGGMLEGYTQVKSTRKDGYVNRVLLLTDGLANTGITDPQQMKKIVETKYKEEGIALSTFGLGADYNEDLLTALAETGRANYYFIDNPDKIPNIFASELKGLLSVVAQNALVEVSIPTSLECVKVYGYPFEVKNNKVQVRLNDIYAKDEKGLLIKFKARTAVKEAISFNCHLQFADAVSFNTISDHKTIQVKETADMDLFRQRQDILVQEMITLFETTEMFDEIMTRVDDGNYEKARQMADSVITVLQHKQKTIRSAKLKEQEETIATYRKDIEKVKVMRDEDKKIYQKSNKSTNYNMRKGKTKSQ